MDRQRDEDLLEPILPKSPPYQREASDEAVAAPAAAPEATRPSWDRLVLVACAVVATIASVIVALRVSSIAEDQRIQTCQIRVYAREQNGFSDRETQRRLTRSLADCVGDDEAPAD